MDYVNYAELRIQRDGTVLTVTMNRPERLNAIGGVMHEELSRLFYDIALDSETDVVILTGAGEAFSAGGDIEWMQEVIDQPEKFEQVAAEAKRIIFGILECDRPIIARLNGAATGLGATIALFCDIIIAADHARIGDPHVRVGFVAGDGGAVIWPQLVGYARAKEYLMTGDLMSAQEAERIGLISMCVDDDKLQETALKVAVNLTKASPSALRWTKLSMNNWLQQAWPIFENSLALEILGFSGPDVVEGLKAYEERRQPVFNPVSPV